jgi:trehalose synthase
LLQPVSVGHKALGDYRHLIGRTLVDEINELAEPLKGKRVLHVSATALGGGVSEILYALVPLMRDAGLEADWHIVIGREELFNVTK